MITQNPAYDADAVSDLYKNAYGFRPSPAFWTRWNHADEAGRTEMWYDVIAASDAACDAEKAEKVKAVDEFENAIATNLQIGAKDRETAIRWIAQASNAYTNYVVMGDWPLGIETFIYEAGLFGADLEKEITEVLS